MADDRLSHAPKRGLLLKLRLLPECIGDASPFLTGRDVLFQVRRENHDQDRA